MFLMENIQLALEGVRSNKMRSLLTMLGIIIGIGSVIGIVTVGGSMTKSVSNSMQSFGVTNIMVNLQEKDVEVEGGPPGMTSVKNVRESDLMTDEMIEKFAEVYDEQVEAISLMKSAGSGKAEDSRKYANVTLSGVNDGYAKTSNVKMLEGRFLRKADISTNKYTAVVSDKLVKNMFTANQNPIGKELKVNSGNSIQTFTIVGVYKYESSAFGGSTVSDKDLRTDIFIPISTGGIITSANKGYQSFTVMAKSNVDSVKFAEEVKTFFNTYYTNNVKYEVGTMSMEVMMESMNTMMGTLSTAIAVIAGISLIVGGVGVMNIMLVSVTERTREIGTRKALGARSSSIKIQFIVEAVIICAIGGILGVISGVSLGYLGSSLLGFPGFPTLGIIVIAVLFSMLIGVFFGYYPANKAASLDPIEALRYE